MSRRKQQELIPRNGRTLIIGVVARISGCASQKEVSLEDQIEHSKEEVSDLYSGPTDYRVISTKGKGEQLDRPELIQVENLIRSAELDLLVMEDVGRLVRGVDAVRLWGIAVDHGIRCIAPNDCVDTADESWEEDLISACRDHVGHNAHTSKRIKKKSMLRFKRDGAATPCPIAGYLKPEGAKSFHDWNVDKKAKPKIIKAAELLREELNCSLVADHLNTKGLLVGPYCRNKEWDGAMVRRYFANPILKGKPERGKMHTVKHHQTGRRKSVKNPSGPVAIDMPHLRILSETEFDELNALLKEENSKMGRKPYANGDDPLKGMPRKRTRFPGQHARCWYCGRIYVWGGNGVVENLQCSGSRSYNCWNSVGISGARFCTKVVDSITGMLHDLQGFDEEFRKLVQAVATRPGKNFELENLQIAKEESDLLRQERNLLDAIAEYGPKPWISERLTDLESQRNKLTIRKATIERHVNSALDLPDDPAVLRDQLQSEFLSLAKDSYEFGRMLPRIVPEVFVYLVRMCDGGPPLARVKFKVDLSGAFSADITDELRTFLVREFTVDLFELPIRARIRPRAVELRDQGYIHKRIVKALDLRTSAKVVADALALDQKMKAAGLDCPLVFLPEPPADQRKMRRHRHERYSFEPLEGYERPTL